MVLCCFHQLTSVVFRVAGNIKQHSVHPVFVMSAKGVTNSPEGLWQLQPEERCAGILQWHAPL